MVIGVGKTVGLVRWLAVFSMVLIIFSIYPPASSDSWPMFFHDPQHTGITTSTAPDSNDILWAVDVGGNGYSSPVVSNGKVFVIRGIEITCLYAYNGTVIWTKPIQPASTASSSPTVANGRVYVAGNRLYCYYANNGTDVWNIPLSGMPGTSSPTVYDNKVFVNTQTLFCFDADDGTEIWNVSVGGNGYSTPAAANDKVFVNGQRLYCFYISNATEIWNISCGQSCSPVIANNKVFINPYQLMVLYENNGTEIWSQPNGGEGYSSPAVANGRIYIHDYDNSASSYKIRCFLESNGQEIWDTPIPGEGCSTPAVSSDQKVIVNGGGNTYCLDVNNGDEIWSYPTGGPGYSSPAVAQGMVIVNQETVYCFGINSSVDYIIIEDDAQNELTTLTLTFEESVIIFAAGYNSTTSSFVRYVEVEWTESEGLGSFDPSIGTSTIFTAGSTTGTTTITGENATMFMSDDFIVEIKMSTVLKQGWNLISIPLIQVDQSITKVLESIDGYYDAVQWYDCTEKGDPWKHFKVGKSFGDDLFELNESKGFWVHITQPGDTLFIYNGTQPSANQTISLNPGWNLVGYPSFTNRIRSDALNNLDFGTHVDSIWSYNATTQKWNDMTGSDYFEVGRGYYIHSFDYEIWEVPL
jgi:outer membrane protein assembly factor BamB